LFVRFDTAGVSTIVSVVLFDLLKGVKVVIRYGYPRTAAVFETARAKATYQGIQREKIGR